MLCRGERSRQAQRRMGVQRQDMSVDELVEEFRVTREQVHAVLQFAAQSGEPNGSGSRL